MGKKQQVNALGVPQGSNSELSVEEILEYYHKVTNVKVTIGDKQDILEPFFNNINDDILNKITTNNKFRSIFKKILLTDNADQRASDYLLSSTIYFVKKLLKLALSSEINYMITLKNNYIKNESNVTPCNVDGFLLSFNLDKDQFIMKESKINDYITEVLEIADGFAKIIKETNWSYIEEIMKLNRDSISQKSFKREENILSTRDKLIKQVQNAKELIMKKSPNNKSSQRAVAQILKMPPQTFRDRLKKCNIDFNTV